MGIISFIFAIFEIRLLKGYIDEIPRYMYILKLMATASVPLPFIVVFAYLGPVVGNIYLMILNSNLFFHLLVPVFSMITFVIFERNNKMSFKYSFYGLVPVIMYALYYLINVLIHMDKGIVSFVFKQKNRWACIRFVCSTMDIMEQYNEIIFEVANSFAFVIPTLLSDKSANRTEIQYYNEALYYYNMEDYDKAMENAGIALQHGSIQASYLLIELYYDEDSPYRDIDKTISYAQQLFDSNKDPDLAFLIGTIYDQQLKRYHDAKVWYENADRLHHKRVPFYLGRFYYYGLVDDGKRDGEKALSYLKRALENGIFEAEPYIKDIESLGDPGQLQPTVEMWERAVKEGIPDTAFKVAMNKKEQVFYMASDHEIEQAFLRAIELGSVQAAYEYGVYCENKEKDENYNGPVKSLDYFYQAYEAGYEEFSKEYLYKVIENKISKGVSDEEKKRLYYDVGKKGSIPAVKNLLDMTPTLTPELDELYEGLKDVVRAGDVDALSSMHLIA